MDAATGDALVCRGGYYASQSALTSSRVYMAGFAVHHGDFVAAAFALPERMPRHGQSDAAAGHDLPAAADRLRDAGNPVLNRNATWTGQGWTISLTDGTGAATTSNAVAEVYCLYP